MGKFKHGIPFRRALKVKASSFWYREIESRRPPKTPLRPFAVTGPPRSGTSLMAAVLSRKPVNVAVINEPLVLHEKLLVTGKPATLVRGYCNATARQAIKTGTIINKVDPKSQDKLTTDTWNVGSVRRPVPIKIDTNKPICIGVKQPLPFMDFMPALCDGWSDLKMIVMVREPGPTIRSWRETTFGWQPALDNPNEGQYLPVYDRVPKCDHPLERRAHAWRLIVEDAVKEAEKRPAQILIVRYEQLLESPQSTIAKIYQYIGADTPDEQIDVSDVKPQKREQYKGFTEEEKEMIEKICLPTLPPKWE